MSNVAAAAALGVDGSTVSKWRSGERTPNADTLAALLELCGGSADYVLGLRPTAWKEGDLDSALEFVGHAVATVRASANLTLGPATLKATGTLTPPPDRPKRGK